MYSYEASTSSNSAAPGGNGDGGVTGPNVPRSLAVSIGSAPSFPASNLSPTSSYRRPSIISSSEFNTNNSNSLWYHGDISASEAESALQNCMTGAFLIYRNGSTRYYLACVGIDKQINHIPIRQIGSTFYFMGEGFATLADIVAFFCQQVEAADPIHSPPSRQAAAAYAAFSQASEIAVLHFICVYDCDEVSEANELRCTVGHILSVLETKRDLEWVQARNEASGELGYVQTRHIIPLISHTTLVSDIPYFHREQILSQSLLHRLVSAGEGGFLLRPSSQGANAYALLVNTGEKIEKFLIRSEEPTTPALPAKVDHSTSGGATGAGNTSGGELRIPESGGGSGGFILAGRRFASIPYIVDRYCSRPISGGTRLRHAVLCRVGIDAAESLLAQTPSDRSSTGADLSSANTTNASLATGGVGGSMSRRPSRADGWASAFVDASDPAADYVNHNFTSQAVASVQALRKSREDKNWKACYLTLYDDTNGGCELVVTDTETSTRPRLELTLSHSSAYWLDDSVFSKDGCVFIGHTDCMPSTSSSGDSQTTYLWFRPTATAFKWMQLLRSRVLSISAASNPFSTNGIPHFDAPSCSSISLLFLNIAKFRSEALKSDAFYSANCSINGVKLCTTPVHQITANRSSSLNSVVFDSSFLIQLPMGCAGAPLQLSILSHQAPGKKGRSFGPVTNGSWTVPDSATPLVVGSGAGANGNDEGFTCRVEHHNFKVLSVEHYAPLAEFLQDQPEVILEWTSDLLSLQQRVLLCNAIVALLLPKRFALFRILRRLLDHTLATTPSDNRETVLRQDTLATALLTQALRIAVRGKFEEFLESQGITGNKATDVDAVIGWLSSLVGARRFVHGVLVQAAKVAKARFGDEMHLVRRVLSAILVLRFTNPLIITSVGYGQPQSSAQQLAKSLQAASNAASSTRLDESVGAARTMRTMFDKVCKAIGDAETTMVTTAGEVAVPVEELSPDWMSIICHLMHAAMSISSARAAAAVESEGGGATTTESTRMGSTPPPMPLPLLRLIQMHQPMSTPPASLI